MAYLTPSDDASKDASAFSAAYERHKDVRRPVEAQWAKLGKYLDPTRAMVFGAAAKETAATRQSSRIYTSSGILNKDRCASTLAAYLINPIKPFLAPNVERSFMVRGLDLDLGADDRDFLDRLKWQAFYNQMRPSSGFGEATSLALNDHVGYGLGVTWEGLAAQASFRWRHRDFKRCYIAENDMGVVDTLWYEDFQPAWRILLRWPQAAANTEFARRFCDQDGNCKNGGELVALIYAVEPRDGPDIRTGGPKLLKPFKYQVRLPDYKAFVLDEGGYDTFPYQVARHKPRDGSPYGSGSLGLNALPDILVLNHYQRGLETNLDLMNDPVFATPEGLFDELSMVPGTFNTFNLNELGFGGNMRDMVQQLSLAGNVSPVVAYMQLLEERIQRHFYADAMELRQNGNMTATEIMARTDLRLRSLSDLVPGLDRDLLGSGADRMLQLMVQERLLPEIPAGLDKAVVEWDYEGPLAAAMRANQVDGLGKLFGMWQAIYAIDPAQADAIDLEMCIRNWVDAQGIEPTNLRSRGQVVDMQAKREAQARAQAEMEKLQAAATALRDGAQGAASLAGVAGGGGVVRPPVAANDSARQAA